MFGADFPSPEANPVPTGLRSLEPRPVGFSRRVRLAAAVGPFVGERHPGEGLGAMQDVSSSGGRRSPGASCGRRPRASSRPPVVPASRREHRRGREAVRRWSAWSGRSPSRTAGSMWPDPRGTSGHRVRVLLRRPRPVVPSGQSGTYSGRRPARPRPHPDPGPSSRRRERGAVLAPCHMVS